ncbi:MAG TPA: DUF308 domain-containing protein [Acidimicrobiia bacterium]|nr:DUF308 domain-containing protein [Acidimicrobiia bacterium]
MTATTADLKEYAKGWWIFIVSGLVWFMISLVVLRFDESSITTVGVIMGIVFVLAALSELLMAMMDESGGFKILNGILAFVFLLGAIWCFVQPEEAFWALASVLGFILLVMGISEILRAVVVKEFNPLWWLGLIAGILLLVLAFWASQQLVTAKADVLLFYIGIMAMFRGLGQIVYAFTLHSAAKRA